MVQEPDACTYRDLLRGCKLRGMFRARLWDDFIGHVVYEMRGGFVDGQCAAVEGQRHLDFGLVGRAGYRGGSLREHSD